MQKNSLLKWIILGVCLVVSGWIMSRGITLGIDLQGGVGFVVQIDEQKLEENLRETRQEWTDEQIAAAMPAEVEKAQKRAIQVIRNRIDSLGIAEPEIYGEGQKRIIVELPGVEEGKREEAERRVKEVGYLTFRLVHKDNADRVQELWDNNWAPDGYTIEDIRDDRRGNSRKWYIPAVKKNRRPSPADLKDFHAPPRYDFMLIERTLNTRQVFEPVFVYRRAEMSGDTLKDAFESPNQYGQPIIKLRFDNSGARVLRNVTKDYGPRGKKNLDSDEGRRLAIVFDDTAYSAPSLEQYIDSKECIISGISTAAEARFLADVLRAGSLPAPVTIVEKYEVGASLGRDSIRSGIRAIVFGGVAVVGFMLVYYLISGIVANLALLLDLLLLPLGVVLVAGFFGIFIRRGTGPGVDLPVLTLHGIAGILLTIGMAVDANILIFERIREEFKLGKTLKAAIAAGYDRAFVTIVDANVTTFLTGVILFFAGGAGRIRGFALMLCGGIIVSMFVAIIVTRLFFELISNSTRLTRLRMMELVKDTKINFVGKRGMAAVLSLLVIATSWTLLGFNYTRDPGRILGVDFLGGSSVTLRVENEESKPSIAEVRDALASAGVAQAEIRYKQPIDKGSAGNLIVTTVAGEISGRKAAEVIKDTLIGVYDASFEEGEEYTVDASFGHELRRRALTAIILSLIGMVLYISWRFEFAFAIGAIVALVHDVLITVGVYCALGRQMNIAIVAALLTIVGYSVNDTIVVFDRIREDLKNSDYRRRMSYREICNVSINETLSRTLLTSATTLVAIVMLVLFGGGSIVDFALALCIGVLVGTYSSVFVATPTILFWHREKSG